MTLGVGYDSAYAPTLEQARAAKAIAGPVSTWWGFYLPKQPNTDPLNGWTVPQVEVLNNAGFQPVPIVVPSPPHPADPVATATTAYSLALSFGLKPTISICYNGEHIAVNGPVWLPNWGAKPTAVGPGSAIQWGQTNIAGLQVDTNVSAPDWPGSKGLVCDLEHNASYDSAWYQQFQATIAKLGDPVTPPGNPAKPMPTTVKVINTSSCSWGPNRIDVFMTGSDGNVYHYYWNGSSWNGYDIINQL